MPSGKEEDITGKKFHHITILYPVWEKTPNGKKLKKWVGKCDCGNITPPATITNFKTGHKKSCGCIRKKMAGRKANDLTGIRQGRLLVVKLAEIKLSPTNPNRKYRYWECKCDCGNTAIILHDYLTYNGVKSCGCMRKGNKSANWRGGKYKEPRSGYVRITWGKHKGKNEHRAIYEDYYKVELNQNQTVHHKNGIRDDNRIENLELWDSRHPSGQLVTDKLDYYFDMVREYSTNPQFREYIQTQLRSLPDSLNSKTNKKSLNKNKTNTE